MPNRMHTSKSLNNVGSVSNLSIDGGRQEPTSLSELLKAPIKDLNVHNEDNSFFHDFEDNLNSGELQLAKILNLEQKEEDWIRGSTENKDLNLEYNQYEHGNFRMKRDSSREKLKHSIFEISKLTNN